MIASMARWGSGSPSSSAMPDSFGSTPEPGLHISSGGATFGRTDGPLSSTSSIVAPRRREVAVSGVARGMIQRRAPVAQGGTMLTGKIIDTHTHILAVETAKMMHKESPLGPLYTPVDDTHMRINWEGKY